MTRNCLTCLFFSLCLFMAAAVLVPAPARAQVSLFADPKAHRTGDLITIVLVERTAAQRESAWDNASDASVTGGAQVSGDHFAEGFNVDAFFSKDARNRNQSVQKDLLNGTITAQVVDVSPAGNLLIQGQRTLSVNGETHLLRVSGLVRPYDVRADNTVLSPQIAKASIEYERSGFHRKFFKPALLARAGAAVLLGAAAFAAYIGTR